MGIFQGGLSGDQEAISSRGRSAVFRIFERLPAAHEKARFCGLNAFSPQGTDVKIENDTQVDVQIEAHR